MKINLNFKKYLNPAPAIGGLEISDLSLRFVRIDNGSLKEAIVQLPPDVVTGGKVKDRAKLLNALRGLHRQIDSSKNLVHAVLVVPASNVSTQTFSMPRVADKELKETAELNLQSISPIDIKTSYHGYQTIGETKPGQLESLGAFASSATIEEFISVLKEANFRVVAVEFPAFSITRLVKEYASGLKTGIPYLVIDLTGDGPDVMIIKDGHLYFNYFNSWAAFQAEVGGRKLSTADVQDFLARHVKQMLNFYSSRWGAPISEVLLVNTPIAKEITQTIKESFGLNVQMLAVGRFNQLPSLWYSSIGAAIRGLVPRSKDNQLSLMAVGVEEEFFREILLTFIKGWRKGLAVVLAFTFLVLLIGDSFLARNSASLAEDLSARALVPLSEIQELQASVQKFNTGVDLALKAQELSPAWSFLLDKMSLLAGRKITIERLFVDPAGNTLLIGQAVDDSAVIAFKNIIEKEENFTDVLLPLSNIKVNTDSTVSFNLNFRVASLEF